jgi:hypothetical protein
MTNKWTPYSAVLSNINRSEVGTICINDIYLYHILYPKIVKVRI